MAKKNGSVVVASSEVNVLNTAKTRNKRVSVETILQEYPRASSLSDLANRLGMPKTSLSPRLMALRKLGIQLKPFTRGAVKRYTPEYVAELQKLYESAAVPTEE